MKTVSVLLPTFNEAGNIESMVEEVLSQEKKLPGYKFEVLIVDSISTDGTGKIAKSLAKKYSNVHYLSVERGLGVATIKGHLYAISHFKPDILVQIDADEQVDPEIIVRLVKTVEEGFDLAIGSRFVPGGKNMLSPSRRFFSAGASVFSRIVMGPFKVREFTNSARAFTPELFKKLDIEKLPWKEKTFIIQPAMLHELTMHTEKYREIPLVFKNRAEGYSKNKVVNYIYDVITYSLDTRLNSWGLNIPVFYLTRRAKTLIKFGLVGVTGTTVDFIFYNVFIVSFGIPPATSKAISTEIAIVNNFILNHFWTFRHRKNASPIYNKLITFNLISLGGLAIGVFIVKLLDLIYGEGVVNVLGINVAFYNLYFFATIPPVMIWNFTINHFITWRNKGD